MHASHACPNSNPNPPSDQVRGGAKLKTIIEEECPDEMRDHIFTNAKREVNHLITFTDAMPGPNANSGPALTRTITL